MIKILLIGILIINLILGLIGIFNFLTHPLRDSGLVNYNGQNNWLIVLILLSILYLKG